MLIVFAAVRLGLVTETTPSNRLVAVGVNVISTVLVCPGAISPPVDTMSPVMLNSPAPEHSTRPGSLPRSRMPKTSSLDAGCPDDRRRPASGAPPRPLRMPRAPTAPAEPGATSPVPRSCVDGPRRHSSTPTQYDGIRATRHAPFLFSDHISRFEHSG